jgi:hypothetical protein
MPNIQYFTPDLAVGAFAGPASAAIAIPAPGDALLLISNLGPNILSFKLGATNAVSCTTSNGTPVFPGQQLLVGSAGMSYVALIAHGALTGPGLGNGAVVNLTSGG